MRPLVQAALLIMLPLQAVAQDAAPMFDPAQLPVFAGEIQLFTLTPRGDIDGFVLTDGTEVKTPPHLTAQLSAAVKPGDRVTIHGLKAASLPLIQAMSVTNAANGRTVVDPGPEAGAPGRPPLPDPREERWDETGSAPLQGRVRMSLHGPRGDVNGVLLDDGSVLRLPPPEAARFSNLFVPGQILAAEGVHHATSAGSFVDLTAVGPSLDHLTLVRRGPRPPA